MKQIKIDILKEGFKLKFDDNKLEDQWFYILIKNIINNYPIII